MERRIKRVGDGTCLAVNEVVAGTVADEQKIAIIPESPSLVMALTPELTTSGMCFEISDWTIPVEVT